MLDHDDRVVITVKPVRGVRTTPWVTHCVPCDQMAAYKNKKMAMQAASDHAQAAQHRGATILAP